MRFVKVFTTLCLSILVLGVLSVPKSLADDHAEFDLRWRSWAAVDGQYRTHENSGGGLTLFTPITQSADSLLFAEFRAQLRESNPIGGSAVLGWRYMDVSGFNFGLWAGADISGTEADDRSNLQLSGGLEAISDRLEVRVNGHLPLTGLRRTGEGVPRVQLTGDQIFLTDTHYAPLYGVDAELGTRLNFDSLSQLSLGLYGGGYHFDSDNAYEPITGYKLRAALEFSDFGPSGSRLTAHYAFSDDNANGPEHRAGLSFRIPLGGASDGGHGDFSNQYARMTDQLERRSHVQLALSTEHEPVEDALTGTDFDRVAYAGQSITDASTAAGDNSLIIANEAIVGADAGQELQGNQTLIGGGTTIQVRGRETGTLASFTAPGARGSITTGTLAVQSTGVGLRLLGSNTHVAGLDVETLGNSTLFKSPEISSSGIYIDADTENVVIERSRITTRGSRGTGIYSRGNSINTRVLNNYINTSGKESHGVYLLQHQTDINLSRNKITTTGYDARGVRIEPGLNNVVIDSNSLTLAGTYSWGISIQSSNHKFQITNNNIYLTGPLERIGIGIRHNSTNFLIANNHVFSELGAHPTLAIVIEGTGNTLAAGSTGNTLTLSDTTRPTAVSCALNIDGATTVGEFIGTFEITVDGVLQTFTDNCTQL